MKQLFAQALQLRPDEWPAFLETLREVGEDEEVVEELRSLLSFHRDSDRADL